MVNLKELKQRKISTLGHWVALFQQSLQKCVPPMKFSLKAKFFPCVSLLVQTAAWLGSDKTAAGAFQGRNRWTMVH
ncbi:hypothetical protein COLO4_11527 [Corchorus olitorius]|uniref:Uncharacterized protein n=1 Tax=Corchorus olitorius TaxID=93759 RepID=A0A1R3K417_9ROSI|nr:hypothetical protein COLO4_11527 [Corchorus olitorius]